MKDFERRIAKHIANLGSESQEVAKRAEGNLIRHYGCRAFEQMVLLESDPNPQVRLRAAWVLGYSHDPRAFEMIVRLTSDPDPSVRYDCAIALGILGDQRAIPILSTLMTQADNGGAAAMGFVRLGSVAAPGLIDLLGSNRQTRLLAIHILGTIGGDGVEEALKGLLDDPESAIRETAKDALEELKLGR